MPSVLDACLRRAVIVGSKLLRKILRAGRQICRKHLWFQETENNRNTSNFVCALEDWLPKLAGYCKSFYRLIHYANALESEKAATFCNIFGALLPLSWIQLLAA